LKRYLWKGVRVGDFLVYGDECDGVWRVRVSVVDIKLVETSTGLGGSSQVSYPYGLTAETGTVRVVFDGHDEIMNLADLIVFDGLTFIELQKAWTEYVKLKAEADRADEEFLTLVRKLRG